MITLETKLKQSHHSAFTHIVGKAVVVYPRERSIHRLDEVGTFIWDCLEQERTGADVVARVERAFEVDHETASRDTADFLQSLLEKHLIEIISSAPGNS